ncbi:hypothetical protein CEUSTIGMA_g4567.t1 [Chlamydomonas eustigma]|uniref:GST N-terminal domain-containing protein n=1 Tax=Chlamydomonas eustigma TaxID=1157962 RepID=A0A250X224_9CHLO|nr:hypothetical protein CEUSTIGMA_g4567.t1 [Chlamydomonas eustigma]|eukprot:GAX77121.1 hypothetical protein CEUSTIGMA_g4567.t1 [Chlamydomonas eustigma]
MQAIRHTSKLFRSPRKSSLRPSSKMSVEASSERPIVYDIPVSNHGARVRFVLYKKGLESMYDLKPPTSIGGLQSEQYKALSPQGKMPLLVLPDGTALPESEVIVQYLLEKHRDVGPSLLAATPELRAKANLITRLHDIYIASIQACMYRAMDSPEMRCKQIGDLAAQLDILDKAIVGPYAAGDDITAADGALFPTMVFCDFMLPTYFGWTGLWETRPKLKAWWATISQDPEAARIIKEVREALDGWAESDRWNKTGINAQVKLEGFKWSY